MSRKYLVRFETRDGKQASKSLDKRLNRELCLGDAFLELPASDTLSLIEVQLLPFADSPGTHATVVEELDLQEDNLASLEATFESRRQPLPNVVVFIVQQRSVAAPAVQLPATNAFAALMAGSRAAQARTDVLTVEEIDSWITDKNPKGQLAQLLGEFLRGRQIGFLPSDFVTLRKSMFLRLNNVFWHVTPQLCKSFARDVQRLDSQAAASYASVEHLLGTERLSPASGDARDCLADALCKFRDEPQFAECVVQSQGHDPVSYY